MSSIRVLELKGSPREMGYKHGCILKDDIKAHEEKWTQVLYETMGMTKADYLEKFFNETDFLPIIERETPDLLEEVKGIAQGADIDFDYCLIRQLSDEEPWFRNAIKFGVDVTEHCTSVGIKRDTLNIIGQNMDTPSYYDGDQVLLKIHDKSSQTLIYNFSIAGKINLCGMNSHSVGICCNSLPQLAFNRKGLPEDFVVRKALTLKSSREVEKFFNSIQHASGQNYLIGDAQDIFNMECSANQIIKMASIHPLCHTNHPIQNTDTALYNCVLDDFKKRDLDGYVKFMNKMTTFKRYRDIVGAQESGLNNEDDLFKALSDHNLSLCLHHGELVTLGSIAMVLNKDNPMMAIRNGRPCTASTEKFIVK